MPDDMQEFLTAHANAKADDLMALSRLNGIAAAVMELRSEAVSIAKGLLDRHPEHLTVRDLVDGRIVSVFDIETLEQIFSDPASTRDAQGQVSIGVPKGGEG